MNQFGEAIVAPIEPRRIEHLEQHRIIRIRRDGKFDDPAGPDVKARDSEMMRQLVPRGWWNHGQQDFRNQNQKDGQPDEAAKPIRLAEAFVELVQKEKSRSG